MIDLELMKKHLYVIGDDDDELIQAYINDAISYIEHHCSRRIVDVDPPEGEVHPPEVMQLDGTIRQAIFQLVGTFYKDRENQNLGSGGSPYHTIIDRLLWTKKRF